MKNINIVALSGNLVRDPEMRATQGGVSIMAFTIAVNDRRKNQNGEWEDSPNYIDCKIIGKRAESIERYLSKGTKVVVQGKLSQSSWNAKDGSKRSKTEVEIAEIEFTNSGRKSQKTEEKTAENSQPYSASDIPF